MKTGMIKACLLMTLFSGCTVHSNGPTTEYIDHKGYAGYKSSIYDVGYGPGANDTDFNHDSVVGYGGVNVYDYDGM